MTPFEALNAKMIEIRDLQGAAALLSWDQETYMPKGGGGLRARQSARLAGIAHQKFVGDMPELLDKLDHANESMDDTRRRNLIQLKRDLEKSTRLPTEHVMAMSQASAAGTQAWAQAKANNDWNAFEPHLQRIVDLRRQEAEYVGYEDDPYDALLDIYEPDLKTRRVQEFFESVKDALEGLLEEIQDAEQVDDSFLQQEIDREKQLAFSVKVLDAMGYDFNRGRQDISAHPFTISMGPDDVRITTSVNPTDIRDMLYSSIHEGGHALYEQGLQHGSYGWYDSTACSLSMHESQSRLWENNVGRMLPFWEHFFEDFRAMFPDKLKGKGPRDVFRAVNRVQPGLVRIYSDELTYHFHIILRFELEHAMVNGDLKVTDLPGVWNEKIKQYLGLEVPNYQKGCLQDIHWSMGGVGYFPTYSLGSFYAAQIMDAAESQLSGLSDQFRSGEFGNLKQWLNEKIHRPGKLYNAEEICTQATGEPLNVEHFATYARKKYIDIYGLG